MKVNTSRGNIHKFIQVSWASVDISFLFIEVSRVCLLVSGLWRERWINSKLIRRLARYPHYRYVFMYSIEVCKILMIFYIHIHKILIVWCRVTVLTVGYINSWHAHTRWRDRTHTAGFFVLTYGRDACKSFKLCLGHKHLLVPWKRSIANCSPKHPAKKKKSWREVIKTNGLGYQWASCAHLRLVQRETTKAL